MKPHDICAHGLARTFQVAKPFGAMTVLDNVMTGAFLRDRNAGVARKNAREAIEFVGLSAREQTAARDLTTIDQRRLEMALTLTPARSARTAAGPEPNARAAGVRSTHRGSARSAGAGWR